MLQGLGGYLSAPRVSSLSAPRVSQRALPIVGSGWIVPNDKEEVAILVMAAAKHAVKPGYHLTFPKICIVFLGLLPVEQL